MPEPVRRGEHARNPALEALLAELGRDLAVGAGTPPAPADRPAHPTVFLVGNARGGTTLAMQWLAAGGAFTYPTNFTARFPTAPWVGERVLRMLTEPALDHRGELTGAASGDPDPWASDLGKTRGLRAPHEFWYWWRRFLPDAAVGRPDADTLRLGRELAAWEAVRHRPLLMKGLIANWCLPWLAEVLPQALFIHVVRDPLANMRSLLAVRRRFYGDETAWYSFRPPEHAALSVLPPADQVAGQVFHTHRAVAGALDAIGADRCFTLAYDELCADPAALHGRLVGWLARHGVGPWARPGPDTFPCADAGLADDPRRAELAAAWEAVAGAVQPV
jgi:hypothetical protein